MTWKCRKELSDWINGLPVQPRRVRLSRDRWDALVEEVRGVPGACIEGIKFYARRGAVVVVPSDGGR